VTGAAQPAFARHWALWAPFMDRRLGAKANYARSIRASGAFSRLETYSGKIEVKLSPQDAAGLLLTASYARAYMSANGLEAGYADQLSEELSPHAPVSQESPSVQVTVLPVCALPVGMLPSVHPPSHWPARGACQQAAAPRHVHLERQTENFAQR